MATDLREMTGQDPLKLALPLALGGLALGAGGTGDFLGGLARGLLQGLEMRRGFELQEEQRAERKAALRRSFLQEVVNTLGSIDDPEQFEQAKTLFRGISREFGVEPGELEIYTFPEGKKKKIKQARAAQVLDQVIKTYGAQKFFSPETGLLDALYEVDGERVSGRDLLKLSGFPIARARRQVTEEVRTQRTEEGGLSRFLAPEKVQVQTREVEEEILPQLPRRVVLGEYDPRFRGTPYESTPVPVTQDGDVDSASLVRFYQLAGIQNPLQSAQARFEKIRTEREDILRRLSSIQQQMAQAKTEEQFRASIQAWNRLISNVRRYKPYLGLTQVPFDESVAVKQWKEARRERRVGPVVPVVGEPVRSQGLDVRPIRSARTGAITGYIINGQQFTIQQAIRLARDLITAGDPRGRSLASILRVPQGTVLSWKARATGLLQARRELQEINQRIDELDVELGARTPGTTEYERLKIQRNQLASRRNMIYKKYPELLREAGGGFTPTGIKGRPAEKGGQPPQSLDQSLDEFFR